MLNGYGAPYVKGLTSLGEVQNRIVDFAYKFSQKGDDVCQVRIESDDQLLPDLPIYQEGVEYTFVWGYISETQTQRRLVVLRNVKASYTEEGVSLDLLFTDKASLTKTNSSKRVYNGKTVKDINEDIGARNGLVTDYLWDYRSSAGLLAAPTTLPTATYFPGPNPDLRKYETMPQANRSDYEVLKEAADNDPSGPYEIVGRDNTITVQKPNFNQVPLRTYRWKGEDGHLLKFTPESKEYFVGSGHLGISTTSVNPKTKTFEHSLITEGNNGMQTKLNRQVASPNYDKNQYRDFNNSNNGVNGEANNAGTPTARPNPIRDDPSVRSTTLNTVAHNSGGDRNYDPTDEGFDNTQQDVFAGRQFNYRIYDRNRPAFATKFANITAIDNTATLSRIPDIPSFLTGQHSPTIEDDHKKASGKAASVQNKKSLEKNPATAKVVGNVILESGKVITIENVAGKFSGNYYIQECIHRMTPGSEYFCDMEFARNATGRVSRPNANSVDTASTNNRPTTTGSNATSNNSTNSQVNTAKGPEINKPKTKTPEVRPADKPNPLLDKFKFKDFPKGTQFNP